LPTFSEHVKPEFLGDSDEDGNNAKANELSLLMGNPYWQYCAVESDSEQDSDESSISGDSNPSFVLDDIDKQNGNFPLKLICNF
jgi:hypothetical protein